MFVLELKAGTENLVAETFEMPREFSIRLNIAPTNREDAWDLCRVAQRYGGVEVSDGCFAFDTEQRWLMALEALRAQFGPSYFEAVAGHEAKH